MPEVAMIGVIGATSYVGRSLLPQLEADGLRFTAFSRHPAAQASPSFESLADWSARRHSADIPVWISLAPIWTLREHFGLLEACGARHVVALSSTSRFTKAHSGSSYDADVAARLTAGEDKLTDWAGRRQASSTILRPTLIYGLGQDANISEIARMIRRFGLFPLFGNAQGLRQPLHVLDLVQAIVAAAKTEGRKRAYDLSGGEILPYGEMVRRVFVALKRRPIMPRIPLGAFRLGVNVLRTLPRYRKWTVDMAERMNQDMVFSHEPATRELGFVPRPFQLRADDLPSD
jgi:nucleoside-diphosphate-sugar epimerase